ncbi:calmodulin-binding protein 60 G-like isoform X1 [Carica papaya]|uniref:calmodulin-binding protein 60 G-like isoform X1 n=2 Tax=Carica papaya TaxID=3649 RepID=UPI000B8D06D0|nr:calmodulin-binding protein 60 G-like isoform X1 [Carica papaya]
MVPKRPFNGDADNRLGVLFQGSKRRHTFNNVDLEVMKGLSLDEIVARLEPLFRAVVREEVERVVLPLIQQSERPQMNQTGASTGRGLRLRFVNKLPHTIYTESRLEAEDRSPVQIELVDASTNRRVVSGPLSSIRIEILVLDGDFGKDGQEIWSEQEFNSKVLRQREGKKPLLTGDLNVTLKEGLGCIGEVVFTDNSCWMRSRKFRLGARIVQRVSGEVGITEGRSEAFVVKDHRGEVYKKHHPPGAKDEIWRLERISKGGVLHKRLNSYHIYTVKDFVRLFMANPTGLRKMLGGGISNKIWDMITEHALSCVLEEEELYTYYEAEHGVYLLFNSLFKFIGVYFNDQSYQSEDKLSPRQKLVVEDLKRRAYGNVNALVRIDRRAIVGPSESLTNPQDGSDLKHTDCSVIDQDQSETQLNVDRSSASTSHTYEADSSQQTQLSLSQNYHPMDPFMPVFRNSFRFEEFLPIPHDKDNVWLLDGSVAADQDVVQPHISATWTPSIPSWEQGDDLFFPPINESDTSFIIPPLPTNIGIHVSRIIRPRAGWCKIRAALVMRSVWRCAAARRMGSVSC